MGAEQACEVDWFADIHGCVSTHGECIELVCSGWQNSYSAPKAYRRLAMRRQVKAPITGAKTKKFLVCQGAICEARDMCIVRLKLPRRQV